MFRFLATLFIIISTLTVAQARTPALPFEIAVSIGEVKGYKLITLVAVNSDVDTVSETIWEEEGIYVFPSAATIMTVSSDSVNDTAAGTGARNVIISGLDTNYDEITETVILNGTTAVSTINLFLRVQGNGLTVTDSGSLGGNDGSIFIGIGTVTAGKPATVFGLINPGKNRSHVGVFTVPNNKMLKVENLTFSTGSAKFIVLEPFERPFGLNTFINIASFSMFQATAIIPANFSQARFEKTDIDIRAFIDVGSGAGKVQFTAILIDKIQ